MLKAADDAGGKKCRCTSCQELVLIPGGTPKGKTSSPAKPSNSRHDANSEWPTTPPAKPATPVNRPSPPIPVATAPKPTVASELDDIIVRQHDQFLQQAAVRHEQMESARRRVETRQPSYSYKSNSSSGSPVKTVLTVVAVIGMLLMLLCCGLLGFGVLGNSAELVAGRYVVSAHGSVGKKSNSFGEASGEAIINRLTGSEFSIYSGRLPSADPEYAAVIKRRFTENSSSQQAVQRGNLSGTRFSGVQSKAGNLPQGVDCEIEVLFDRDYMIITCYISGSQKQKAGLQKPSRWESLEESLDRPESFFSSLRTTSQ
ncbi:MAG: hypothetical protein U0930_00865 [Pirellulales bacterium]